MKVLIGITSKNREEILPKAIRSALTQNYPDKAVAIYDDASTDGTAKLEQQFTNVNWVLSDQAHGYVYARNMFLTLMENDVFCSLDDDSWFLNENALAIGVDYMKQHPDVGAIAFDILSPDDIDKQKIDVIKPQETNMFIGCGHLLRTDVVKKLSGYIPNPGFYGGEEKDLCIRLIDAGYKVVKLNGLYVWHDKTSVARNLAKQHRSGVCNDMVFMFRRTPAILLVPSLFVKVYKHIKFSIRMALFKPCLLGLGDFVMFLFTFKLKRDAVSMAAFKKYLSLQ